MTAEELNAISKAIIAAAIEVHKRLGNGLLESVYRRAMVIELREAGYFVEEEVPIPVTYKGHDLGIGFRLDLLVERSVAVECKVVEAIVLVHASQLRSYLVIADLRLGLIINFHEPRLTDGIKRIVNNFPDSA